MTVWRLKKGADRRLRQGHPWVFQSELAHSSKEVLPGQVVELHDAADKFLGFGYAHPTSQISFRRLSSRSKETDVLSTPFFLRRFQAARALRQSAGWTGFSHRWVYAEADGLPGLMVDAFKLEPGKWLAVVQASTAGMERALPEIFEALSQLASEFGELSVIEAPSSRSRLLEGLKVSEKKLVLGPERDWQQLEIELLDGLKLRADFMGGQKTGFFLDQQWNASLLKKLLRDSSFGSGSIRVLDICCYVGQWAAHATAALKAVSKSPVQCQLLDTSAQALELAAKNVEHAGGQCEVIEGDALEKLSGLTEGEFDVVICDPPAFVKKKADLESGLRAYTKLNRDALRLLRPGGIFVSSSCSGLVKTADYTKVLQDASAKAGRMFQQVFLGGHGPDHPLRPEFPEGEYLKCHLGRVDYPF